jgi:hypothetical protein
MDLRRFINSLDFFDFSATIRYIFISESLEKCVAHKVRGGKNGSSGY